MSTDPSSSSHPPPEDFERFLPHLTNLLDNLTTHAASLPLKSDLAFHKTLDRKFGKGLDGSAEEVLALTGKLLRLSASSSSAAGKDKDNGKGKGRAMLGKLGEDDLTDRYKRTVVDVVDGLLEDADSRLDDLSGRKKKAAISIPPQAVAAASQKLPGPAHARYDQGLLPANLRNDTTIPKPQLLFADQPNNSTSLPPWTPTLHSKPHAMVPLDFVPSSNLEDLDFSDSETDKSRAAKVRAKRHPYWYETRHLPYPTSMFTSSPPVAPRSFEDTPFSFVDTVAALDELEQKIREAKEVAVDLEHHDMRSYHGFTCLIQISTRDGDWIVDALKLRQEIRERKFGDVFADPNVVKVFHGADSDILWLQQDFDIYIVNLFDTYHATVVLGLNSHSLAGLLSLYCNFTADKRYQMADWRIRPLASEMLHYARADTHFLLFIYDNLRNALLEKSSRAPSPILDDADAATPSQPTSDGSARQQRRNPQETMRRVLKRSAETATRLYEREEYRALNPDSVGKRWLAKKEALGEAGWVFSKIHAWRDRIAREEDESPFYIMPNHVLANLARLEHPSIPLIRKITSQKAAPAAAKAEHLYTVMADAKAAWASGPPAEWTPAPSRARSPYIPRPFASASAGVPTATAEPAAEERDRTYRSPPPPTSAKKNWPVPERTSTALQESRLVRSMEEGLDLWTHLQTAAPVPTESRSQSSRLFGSAAKPRAKSPLQAVEDPKRVVSSLFGSALANGGTRKISSKAPAKSRSRAKSKSPGFENVMAGIHATLGPPPSAAPTSTLEAPLVASSAETGLPESETVPFVPKSGRTTLLPAGGAISATDASNETPATVPVDPSSEPIPAAEIKAKKKNEIVEVRRKKGKKRDRDPSTASASSAPIPELGQQGPINGSETGSPKKKSRNTSPAAAAVASHTVDPKINNSAETGASADPSQEAGKKKKKDKKKKKIDPADIPVFDYSTAPNLLDNPAGVAREQEGKGKKKKKEAQKKKRAGVLPSQPTSIEVPRFGASAAKDMTGPKGGNRSGTFNH